MILKEIKKSAWKCSSTGFKLHLSTTENLILIDTLIFIDTLILNDTQRNKKNLRGNARQRDLSCN